MTSTATHDDTVAFFEEHRFFGLPHSEVFFFQQGTMPAVDLASGKLLLEKPGVLFTSPNGHGGTLTALPLIPFVARAFQPASPITNACSLPLAGVRPLLLRTSPIYRARQ